MSPKIKSSRQPIVPTSSMYRLAVDGFSDVRQAILQYRIAFVFGWQDVAQRYRRSRVGPFWLTINMAIFVAAVGTIFGTLFQSEMSTFLPHLCAGVIVWSYISTSSMEGCTSFISNEGIILQVRMPLFTHIIRTLWKNAIILFHNVLIFPLLLIFFGKFMTLNSLWAIPGLIVLSINLSWIMLLCAIVCTRFRDITQIVANIFQVLFYATPIMWMTNVLPDHVNRSFIELNPLYHLLQLVRAPLLGQAPTFNNWTFTLLLAAIGWTMTILFFGRYRKRIAYWL